MLATYYHTVINHTIILQRRPYNAKIAVFNKITIYSISVSGLDHYETGQLMHSHKLEETIASIFVR